jgi:hypothetical protein
MFNYVISNIENHITLSQFYPASCAFFFFVLPRTHATINHSGAQFTKVMCLFAITIAIRPQTYAFTVKNLKQPIFALFLQVGRKPMVWSYISNLLHWIVNRLASWQSMWCSKKFLWALTLWMLAFNATPSSPPLLFLISALSLSSTYPISDCMSSP